MRARLSDGTKALPLDIKTVTGGGPPGLPTGGVLSVWPSPGKSWQTGSLFETPPAPLPDDLLDFLVARHKTLGRPAAPHAPRAPQPRLDASSFVAAPAAPVAPPPQGQDDIRALLNLVGKHRWDDRSDWRDIATALKNTAADRDKALWIAMSRISAKFDLVEADRLWASVANDPAFAGHRLGLGSIHHMARLDNPHGYAEFRSSRVPAVVSNSWDKQDRGLADIAHYALHGLVKRVGRSGDVYFFDGVQCRWLLGTEVSVRRMVSVAVEDLLRDLELHFGAQARAEAGEPEKRALDAKKAAVSKRIDYIRKTSGAANVTSFAIHMLRDDHFVHLLDSKPHLLGVKNGVIDLRTGALRARCPDDMIFTVLDVSYDPDADDALIRATVLSAMADDVEMAAFIQKLLGYGCTGEVCEEIFPVFTGNGRNSKGVLVKAVQDVLGDAFFKVLNNGIIVDKNVSNIDAERGCLFGARFALFNELRDGDKLKTNEVQLLSGGDCIPATPKYKDPMNIQPRHLCLLTTNHMPELSVVIPAIMERMMCINFPVTFADLEPGEEPSLFRRQRDNDLKRRISEDKVGVLKWLVDGAVAWYAAKDLKKNAPAKVKEFSRKYFEEQDRLACFLREWCVIGPDLVISTSAFLETYNRHTALSSSEKWMSSAMRVKGFDKKRVRSAYGNVNSFVGVGLIQDTDD